VKSSLTLVPLSDNAAQEQEKILLSEAEISSDKKPRLRLVSPEVQADLIKEALSKKPNRKARKRNTTKAADTPDKAKADKAQPVVKKPRKPYTRKAKPEPAQSIEPTPVTADMNVAIAGLLSVLHQACEKQTAELYSLLQSVIHELGDEAPLEDASEEILCFVEPETEAAFAAEVEALINGTEPSEPLIEDLPALQHTYNFIGELFISEENDPFKETEWTLFEEDFTSRWYDTKKEALHGLHDVMVNAGLNYACELKVLTRVFALGDYLYHKYAVGAVVGIYSEHQPHADKAICDGQSARIHAQLIPDSLDVLQRISARHKADISKQIKPESQLYDKSLKWFSVGCLASLAYAMISMAINTGFF
jgi:hypothetical protein